MEFTLAQNIRSFRRERKLTQEQLAEVLGVTVGAVHKWEKSLSTPDLSLIFAMADLFETSTDVLLGYRWRKGNVAEAIDGIRQLIREKKCREAVEEAEKIVRKFPNNFEIVHQTAMAYLEWSHTFDMNDGLKDWQESAHTRGEAVFQHALELLPQNTDPGISRISLARQLAEFHEFCMYIYDAIDVLKENNVCGINNALIGKLYVTYLHDPAKAEAYLSKAYCAMLRDMEAVLLGFSDICSRRGDPDHAIACIEWLRTALRGIQPEGELTSLEKYDVFLLRVKAYYSCEKGDFAGTKMCLKEALEKAVRFDSAAEEEIRPMKIHTLMNITEQPPFTSIWAGKSTLEWLRNVEYLSSEELPRFREIWDEVKKEVLA